MTSSEQARVSPVGEAAWDYDSFRTPPRAIEEVRELRAHWPLVMALLEREIKVRYKRSVLGFVWTMAHPLLLFVILTLIFSRAFSAVAPRYPAFLLPGLLIWTFFSQTLSRTASEVAAGVDLWRRVKAPRTAFAVTNALSGVFQLILASSVVVLIFAVIGSARGIALLTLPVTLILATVFTLGSSLLVASVALRFPDVNDMLQLLLPAWMFATPIIYPQEIVGRRLAGWLLWNPLTCFVEGFRAPIYEGASPSTGAFLLMVLLSIGAIVSGWIVFTRAADHAQSRG